MPATDTDLVTGYWTLRNDVAAVPVERDLVLVEGTDAESFLQGQLSQDMATLVVTGPAWSFLLQPTGKVDAWVRVARLGAERFVIDVDGGFGPAVVARLERFKLRVKVTVTQLEGWTSLTVRGPNLGAVDLASANAELIVPADWSGSPGADLFGPLLEVPEGLTVAPVGSLEVLRVECGVPRMGSELDEHTIPAEAGQWVIDASVSFTKGCFTGQELVARIDSRGGNVPRHLRAVVFAPGVAPSDVAAGASITVGDKVVGALTSVVQSPARDAVVGLAYVGRAVEPPASVTVAGTATDGGVLEATVESLPLLPPT